MRLSSNQIQQIKHHTHCIYGANVCVYLFGSRVNEMDKGGDIDLLIEVEAKEQATFANQFKLSGALQLSLGPQKIDIISHVKGQPTNEIQQQALQHGIRL